MLERGGEGREGVPNYMLVCKLKHLLVQYHFIALCLPRSVLIETAFILVCIHAYTPT